MKILFLDMDGVLNSHQSSHYFYKRAGKTQIENCFSTICPIASSNLDYLLEKIPDLKVVISSTWRLHYELSDWDKYMSQNCPNIVGRVIGKTPCFSRLSQPRWNRGDEIHEWLSDNGHLETSYAVIDDDSDMDKVRHNFFHIDNHVGLTWTNIIQLANHFKISPLDVHQFFI